MPGKNSYDYPTGKVSKGQSGGSHTTPKGWTGGSQAAKPVGGQLPKRMRPKGK